MSEKTTYLLPIWIDLEPDQAEVIMKSLNEALTEFFEEQIANLGCAINVQWSINKHVGL